MSRNKGLPEGEGARGQERQVRGTNLDRFHSYPDIESWHRDKERQADVSATRRLDPDAPASPSAAYACLTLALALLATVYLPLTLVLRFRLISIGVKRH